VTLTTYALSLSFFEAIVLDRLIRGGGRQAMILADVEGVRASLVAVPKSSVLRPTCLSPSRTVL